MCDDGKFVHIMNSLEKAFYGGNAQFLWKDCSWIELQSELSDRQIHHTSCGHEVERAVKIDKKEILVLDTILRHQLSISSMDAADTDVFAWKLTMARQSAVTRTL